MVSYARSGQRTGDPVEFRFDSRHDFQQCGLPASVQAHDADFGSGVEGEIDVFENVLAFVRESFGEADEGEHELTCGCIEACFFDGGFFLVLLLFFGGGEIWVGAGGGAFAFFAKEGCGCVESMSQNTRC